MQCSGCGTKNLKKFKYCKECGEELILAAVPAPASPQPQPTVVIIRDEKERRGVPGFIWILVGMILVVLMCGLLVWLDFVDVPDAIRVRLPGPIGEIVDAIDDARPPGAGVVDVPGGVVNEPDDPGQVQQPPQPQPTRTPTPRPPRPQQPEPPSDACDEDLANKFVDFTYRSEYYTGLAFLDLEFDEPLQSDEYALEIRQGNMPMERYDCQAGSSFDGYHLCQDDGPFEWDDGEVVFRLIAKPDYCDVGQVTVYFDCSSGEAWYPNWSYGEPAGCCTVGCWCDDGSGNMGCWQDCAPACAN